MPEPRDTFRLRALLRDTPRSVLAITALFLGVLLLHSALTPLYRAPDEARHVDQVLHLREGDGYPPPGKEVVTQQVLGSYVASGYAVADPSTPIGKRRALPYERADAPDLGDAPAYRDVPPPSPPQAQLNQMTQHPPGYYALGAAVLWLVPRDAHLPFPWVIGILRLLSVACVVLLPWTAFHAARRLGSRWSVAAAAVPLAVPQLAHIGSSVTNDSLLIGAMSLLTVGLVHVAMGDLSKGTAVRIGLVAAVALFTKAFALAAVPCIVVAYAIALLRTRSRLAVGGLIVSGTVSALGGWWYVVNVLRYGKLQSEETQVAFPAPQPGFSPSLSAYADNFASRVSTRFWGEFGYLEVPLSRGFTTTASIVLLLLVALGLVVAKPRLPGLALALPLAGVTAIMVVGTYGLYRDYGFFPGLQGRYLFPGLAGVGALVAVGLGAVVRRGAPLTALVLALGCQLYGVRVELREIWGGSLRAVAAWCWYPGWLVYAVVVGIVVAAVAAVVVLLREALLVEEPA